MWLSGDFFSNGDTTKQLSYTLLPNISFKRQYHKLSQQCSITTHTHDLMVVDLNVIQRFTTHPDPKAFSSPITL